MAHLANLTISSAGVSATHTNFPKLVRGSDFPANIWSTATASGGDLRFFLSDGTTEIPREIVSFDNVAETAEIWIKIPSISDSSDTIIQIHADGSSADYANSATFGRNAVWSDYEFVWHGEDLAVDSTGNHTLASVGSPGLAETGSPPLNSFGNNFDSGNFIRTTTGAGTFTSPYTLQGWGRSAAAGGRIIALGSDASSSSDDQAHIALASNLLQLDYRNAELDSSSVSSNTWYFAHGVEASGHGSRELFLDGSSLGTNSTSKTSFAFNRIAVGASADTTPFGSDTDVDETRLRYSALSSDWIADEYKDQTGDANWHSIAEVSATDDVTITEAPASGIVFQRGSSVTFTGTYVGSPTALQYRVLDAADDTTELVGWTTFDASPSGGTFSLSFTPPTTTDAMHVEVRFSNDTGVTDLQVTDWRYGIRGLIYGQSLGSDLEDQDAVTPPAGYVIYNGTNFVAPTTGRGQNALAQKLIDMYGCSVCITNTAVSASKMTTEAEGGSNHWSNEASTLFTDTIARVNGMTNNVNTLEFALFIQGNADAANSIPTAQYLRINERGGISELVANSRANWTDKNGNSLPIIVGIMGKRTSSPDADVQAIREAHLHVVRTDNLLFPLPLFHLGYTDGVHPNDTGDTAIGENTAVLVAFHNGDVSVDCPDIVSAEINAGATEITLEYDSDLLTSDTTYGTEGIRVEDAGSPVTVSSFTRETARKAKVTLSSAITNTDQIEVFIGYGAGSGNTALTYPSSANITLPNSAGTHNLPALNAKIDLVELV